MCVSHVNKHIEQIACFVKLQIISWNILLQWLLHWSMTLCEGQVKGVSDTYFSKKDKKANTKRRSSKFKNTWMPPPFSRFGVSFQQCKAF